MVVKDKKASWSGYPPTPEPEDFETVGHLYFGAAKYKDGSHRCLFCSSWLTDPVAHWRTEKHQKRSKDHTWIEFASTIRHSGLVDALIDWQNETGTKSTPDPQELMDWDIARNSSSAPDKGDKGDKTADALSTGQARGQQLAEQMAVALPPPPPGMPPSADSATTSTGAELPPEPEVARTAPSFGVPIKAFMGQLGRRGPALVKQLKRKAPGAAPEEAPVQQPVVPVPKKLQCSQWYTGATAAEQIAVMDTVESEMPPPPPQDPRGATPKAPPVAAGWSETATKTRTRVDPGGAVEEETARWTAQRTAQHGTSHEHEPGPMRIRTSHSRIAYSPYWRDRGAGQWRDDSNDEWRSFNEQQLQLWRNRSGGQSGWSSSNQVAADWSSWGSSNQPVAVWHDHAADWSSWGWGSSSSSWGHTPLNAPHRRAPHSAQRAQQFAKFSKPLPKPAKMMPRKASTKPPE